MFNPSQQDVRRFFCETWQKHQSKQLLSEMESMALRWILEHPEYHADLSDLDAALAADYSVDDGKTNPFLHLSMHLAISEQLSIDQPPGIRAAHERLSGRLDSPHQAAHEVMECLGQIMWEASRNSQPPDSNAYLQCIERRATRGPAR